MNFDKIELDFEMKVNDFVILSLKKLVYRRVIWMISRIL